MTPKKVTIPGVEDEDEYVRPLLHTMLADFFSIPLVSG